MVLDLKAGEVAFLQQEPTMGIIMARNNLFRLDDVQGKYHVKTLEPGTLLPAAGRQRVRETASRR